MGINLNVNFSMSPTSRLVLKNLFWIKREKSQPAINVVNLEIFKNGAIVFNINPDKDEPSEEKFYLGNLQYGLVKMTNGVFDGLKINGDMFFVVPKEELTKINFANIPTLAPVPGDVDSEYEGKNLCEADNLTTVYISKFTQDIKNDYLDLLGFPQVIDTGALKRLVLFGAFHYDQMFKKGSLIYCNLEIYPNGRRRFEKDGDESVFSPDDLLTVYQLVPLTSGSFTALIDKQRRKTENPNIFPGKDFYIISNQEAKKFQNINIEKDLYKLVEDEDFLESDNFFEGRELAISSDNTKPLISNDVKNEFLRIIQNSK